jgi:hypothetical protein
MAAAPLKGEGVAALDALCRPRTKRGRTVARFSPLNPADLALFKAALAGQLAMNGFRNAGLGARLYRRPAHDRDEAHRRCERVSRLSVKLRGHGPVAKVPRARLYRVIPYGQRVMTAALALHDDQYPPTTSRSPHKTKNCLTRHANLAGIGWNAGHGTFSEGACCDVRVTDRRGRGIRLAQRHGPCDQLRLIAGRPLLKRPHVPVWVVPPGACVPLVAPASLTVMMTDTMDAVAVTADGVVERLTDNGYAIVSGMMSPEQVDVARTDLRRLLDSTPTGRNSFEGFTTQRVYALFAKTRTFDQAAIHPLLLGVLDRLLGHYQLSAPVGIQIGPGEEAQVLHRDESVYPLPRPHPPVVVNTMWPLGDLWHGGGANKTERPRLGVILEYVVAWLRPQENHCLAVPRRVAPELSEPLQDLLGYNIYPPFLGYVDGSHPRKVLQRDD